MKFIRYKKRLKQIFLFLLTAWTLRVGLAKSSPIPGADGFQPSAARVCPSRQTYSKDFSSMSTKLQENPANHNTNGFKWDRQFEVGENYIIMKDYQVLKKFKHANDFGVIGNACRENFEIFKNKLIDHMKDPGTVIKKGTFKKDINVTHYTNYETSLL